MKNPQKTADSEAAPTTGPVRPSDAKAILERDLENLRAKVGRGAVLTAGERRLLNQTLTAAPAGEYVTNQAALAEALKVTRQTIHRWLRAPGNPGRRADGRYSVTDWTAWQAAASDSALPGVSELKARLVAVQIERIEHALAVARGEFIPRIDVERWGGELGAAVRKIVTQIHLAAPSVVGVSVPEAEIRLKEIEDDILQQLHLVGDRLASSPPGLDR
jgi:hypothetical protein